MPRLFPSRRQRQTELLSAYLDGRLSPREQAEVERLLEASEEARRELDALRAVVALVQQAPAVQPPRSFTLRPEMVAARAPARAGGVARVAAPAAVALAAFFLAFSLVGGSVDLFTSEPSPAGPTSSAPDGGPSEKARALHIQETTPAPAPTPRPESAVGALAPSSGSQGVPTPAPADQFLAADAPGGRVALAGEPLAGKPPQGGSSFPWLALQLAAGGLTGVAIVAALWQYRRSRARV